MADFLAFLPQAYSQFYQEEVDALFDSISLHTEQQEEHARMLEHYQNEEYTNGMMGTSDVDLNVACIEVDDIVRMLHMGYGGGSTVDSSAYSGVDAADSFTLDTIATQIQDLCHITSESRLRPTNTAIAAASARIQLITRHMSLDPLLHLSLGSGGDPMSAATADVRLNA